MEFLLVVEDFLIEFELVVIECVEIFVIFFFDIFGGILFDNVKEVVSGGSDVWDMEYYFNIWVCNIEGGVLLGYVYLLVGLDYWLEGINVLSFELDGVVIYFEVFCCIGEFMISGLLGLGEVIILVCGCMIMYEVGYYFGFCYIWGDGIFVIFGILDCIVDDGVVDMLNQGLSS